jgi:hypothetical protein
MVSLPSLVLGPTAPAVVPFSLGKSDEMGSSGQAVDLVSALEGRHQISFPAHATSFPFFVCDFPSAFSVSGASGSSLRLAKKNGEPMKDQ